MSLLIHGLVHYVGYQHNSNFFLVCPWWTLPLPTVNSPKFSPCRLSVGALSISASNFASYFIKMLEVIHCRFPHLCTDRAISSFNLIFFPLEVSRKRYTSCSQRIYMFFCCCCSWPFSFVWYLSFPTCVSSFSSSSPGFFPLIYRSYSLP